ncbi:hypothetical protein [Silvibacterium acidisoli]|uniref:hypothetical protein n=1 Tax=Acidobacteriaceae bacterium ZG23-2 TaxID=2883246 RepID=UPI00406C30B3
MNTTFRELCRQLKSLKETLDGLRCLLPDDPLNTEVVLMRHLRESVDSVNGWLDDCVAQSQIACAALEQASDINDSRRALTQCQASFDEAERASSAELLTYEKLREVVRLGGQRKGIWIIWSQNTKRDLESCRYELYLTRKAMTACWQELAEHAGMNGALRTPDVRQRITAAASGIGDMEVEGAP